ncbi:hypothetical protein ACFSL4_14485 [Streptomyces caeni]|uniref:Uncharacterized protein n=1 Tax=Streptomyces caeni TaxID=2307231 RepID=A0ABW4IS64_9ACTN
MTKPSGNGKGARRAGCGARLPSHRGARARGGTRAPETGGARQRGKAPDAPGWVLLPGTGWRRVDTIRVRRLFG